MLGTYCILPSQFAHAICLWCLFCPFILTWRWSKGASVEPNSCLESAEIKHSTIYTICFFMSVKSCQTLCDLMDCSLPGSYIHRILQARILEWVAMLCPRGSSPSRDRIHVSCGSRQILYPWAIGKAPCFFITIRDLREKEMASHSSILG